MSHVSRFRRHRAGATAIVLSAAMLTVSLALHADQAAPPAKPLVPMTASSLLRNPAPHIGENVSLMAAVEAILAKTAFTVDQDKTKSTGKDVLILAPTLTQAPELNAYLTIQGEVVRFDRADIDKRSTKYLLDIPADAIAKYEGQPVILATAVITNSLVDLAKHLPPPMTPAELGFRQLMMTINPASTAIRAGVDQPDAAATLKDQVAALKKSFTDVEAYFKAHGPAGAVTLADNALALATSMDQSLADGKMAEVKASFTSLQLLCTSCHAQFRERQDDGSYRIKSGG